MEFYNKYLPKTIDDYYLHPELQTFLKTLKNKNLPNLILYGYEGCGKKSLLNILYNSKKSKITETIKYNSKNIDYTIYNSKETIEIDSKELKIYNKYLLQNIIKNIAETKRVNDNQNKIIILHNADHLDKEFQYVLRKMIELYENNAKFILVSNSLTKMINPIKSRCLCIPVNSPTDEEITEFLKNIIHKENLKISSTNLKKIISNNSRNLKRAILQLEMYCYKNIIPDLNKNWINIETIIKTLKNKNFNQTLLNKWETELYNLIINISIEDENIIKMLFEKIIEIYDFNDEFKIKVLEITCDFDKRITKGSKAIIHLNAYLAQIYNLIKNA